MTVDAGGSLDPRGPAAGEIADLWWLMFGLGLVVLVMFLGALALGLFRRRGSPDSQPHERPATHSTRWIVVGGVVMPFIVLIVVLAFTVSTMRSIPDDAPPGAVVIEVIGHQWWWEVRYPDHEVTTTNEMHIPVGRPIELRLTSADVIHSFWVPELAGKLDLLPQDINTLVLEADEPGEYRGQCAEFCGLEHALMRFVTIAEPPERFETWLASQPRTEASG